MGKFNIKNVDAMMMETNNGFFSANLMMVDLPLVYMETFVGLHWGFEFIRGF